VIAPAQLHGEAAASPGGGVPYRIRGELDRDCHHVLAGGGSRQQPGQPAAKVSQFGVPARETPVPPVRAQGHGPAVSGIGKACHHLATAPRELQ
jgi:hypothetical protein